MVRCTRVWHYAAMPLKTAPHLDHLDADALRALAEELMGKVEQQAQTIHFKDTRIRKLTHEIWPIALGRKLAVRWLAAGWPPCGRHHESDPVGRPR